MDTVEVPSATAQIPSATSRDQSHDPSRAPLRAWVTWGAAISVYLVAVFNRGSLGVAGVDAEHRFGISAASLSTFSVLQLLVYAGMQVPVGLLIDRFGPRRLLLTGLGTMCVAQACFATVDSFVPALVARGLLGCGDAMIFISVLRIIVAWFPARSVPLLTQLSALVGAAGGIICTWPLSWALGSLGWSGTFLLIAGVGACVLALPVGIVRDTPHGRQAAPAHRAERKKVSVQMREAWRRPQTRLGLWMHFTTGFSANVFSLLWGYPFLVQGEGLSGGVASGLLTLLVCGNMVCGVVFGIQLTRHPQLRVPMALGVIGLTALALTAVLAWPGRAPLWLLVMLTLVYSTNGSGSMIAFDVARSASPPEGLGTTTGMVNVGSFLASAITLLAVGVLIDRTGAEHAASVAGAVDGFKIAFCFPYVLLSLGTFQILRLSRLIRRSEPLSIS